MYIRRHLLGLLPRLIHLLSNPSTFHLIIPNLISEYFRVFGFSLITSSVMRVIVSCTHCVSAASSVKSICRERLRGVDDVALAVFVNVSRCWRRMSSWNRNSHLKCVSAICGAVSTTCALGLVWHVTHLVIEHLWTGEVLRELVFTLR